MELASFRVQNNVNIFQEKLGSRVVQVEICHDSENFHENFHISKV